MLRVNVSRPKRLLTDDGADAISILACSLLFVA
jgi:hypothetical protein